MKFLVVYEFDKTLESKEFDTPEEVDTFLKDEDKMICQSGDFVKYVVIEGIFVVTSGFMDRT
jgi:hypothetical protein